MKYEDLAEGKWVTPFRNSYKASCCDCGLVHRFDLRVRKGKIQYRAYRDNRATGQIRRHMKK